MNDLTILARVRALIGDATGKPAADCADDATLESLDMDSLDVVKLSIEVEDYFDIDVKEDDELERSTTVAKLAEIVERLRKSDTVAL